MTQNPPQLNPSQRHRPGISTEIFKIYTERYLPKTPFGPSLPRRDTASVIDELEADGVTRDVWISALNSCLMSRGFLCCMRPTLSRLVADHGTLLFDVVEGKYADWLTSKPESRLTVDSILAGARPRDWLAPPVEDPREHHPQAYCRALRLNSPSTVAWVRWRFDVSATKIGKENAARAILGGSATFQRNKVLLGPLIEGIYGPEGAHWVSDLGV